MKLFSSPYRMSDSVPNCVRYELGICPELYSSLDIHTLGVFTVVYISWEKCRDVLDLPDEPENHGKTSCYIFENDNYCTDTFHKFESLKPWNTVDVENLLDLLTRFSNLRKIIWDLEYQKEPEDKLKSLDKDLDNLSVQIWTLLRA